MFGYKKGTVGKRSVDIRYALAEACLIGILSALAALLLKSGVNWLGSLRLVAAQHFGSGVVLPLAGLFMGMLAGWLIDQFAPTAAGGGVPQVKAVLAGYPLACSWRVAFIKAISTILILGAGLTLGRRGPTVHIGAALAAQLAIWVPTSPEHRRRLIAAGAAAGLAAGFNTPIAGVVFAVEELSRDVSGLTLETAIFASFTGAVVSRWFGSADLNVTASIGHHISSSFSLGEIPFYLVLGLLAGFLGSVFNRAVMFFVLLYRRLQMPLYLRIAAAGVISGAVLSLLPPFFQNNAGLRDFLLTGDAGWQMVAIAFIAHFILTPLAYGSGAPGGLFAPGLVMGSALGYLVGTVGVHTLGFGSIGAFCFAGMGAFFTAVVRVPITAIVIVFEITSDFNLVLPLMLTCALSYVVAESFYPGSIYQHLLEANGMKLNDHLIADNDLLIGLQAKDVMHSEVETLPSGLSLDEVKKVIAFSHHRGFPVVENGRLVGIITQSDLTKLTNTSEDVLLKDIMTLQPITINPQASLSDVLYLLDRYELSRLPVTQGNKVVGIITRSDIIRAEVNKLSCSLQNTVKDQPSYVIYQTSCSQTGRGRILLPIVNEAQAANVLQMAVAIARERQYEIECLMVIKIPKHCRPHETEVNSQSQRKILRRLERLSLKWGFPIYTQIRVANDICSAIVEALVFSRINLMIMGWKGKTSTQGAIFGDLVDSLIQKANCELLLIKLGTNLQAFPQSLDEEAKWLLPTSGGPNALAAIKFLPGLISLYKDYRGLKIWLTQVDLPTQKADYVSINERGQAIEEYLNVSVYAVPLCSTSVSDAIISLAQANQFQLIVLGATREGLLKQAISGSIPQAIAQAVDTTVILVREAT